MVKLCPSEQSKRNAAKIFQPILEGVNQPTLSIISLPKSETMLKDFTTKWLTQVAVNQRDSSQRAVRSHINTHINPRLGDRFLIEINNEVVQGFVTNLAQERKRSRKTIKNILHTLSSILGKAKSFGYACGQFCTGDLVLPPDEQMRQVWVLMEAEVAAIIAHAKEPYVTMFAILGMTGIRASELLGLQLDDLDFRHNLIHIRRSLDSRTLELQPTKTKASANPIPMPPELAKRLLHYLQNHRRENVLGFLFTNRNGNPYAIGKVVEYGLWPAQDAAGIRRTGLHAFRHQVATELQEHGAPLRVVQRQLRHSDPRTTLRYTHVIEDTHRKAVEGLAAAIERHVAQLESNS